MIKRLKIINLIARTKVFIADAFDWFSAKKFKKKLFYSLDPKASSPNCESEVEEKGLYSSILLRYSHIIEASFDVEKYQELNADLKELDPLQVLRHFRSHGISEWRRWDSSSSLLDRRYATAIQFGTDIHLRTKMQAIVHCYHYDVLCEQKHYLRQLARVGADIHLLVANTSICDEQLTLFLDSLAINSSAHTYRRVTNYGEDWSSFHEGYREGLFDGDGITFKLQTKQSRNLGADGGLCWIDDALSPLCGNISSIIEVAKALSDDSHNIAASALTKRVGFGANQSLVFDFIKLLGLHHTSCWEECPFAAGSMFAASNSFIRSFYEALGPIDYSKIHEKGTLYCGRFAGHAIERVFFYYSNHHDKIRTGGVFWKD